MINNPDLRHDPDFGHCRSLRPHIPTKVTFGEFDANLNTGHLAAHVEYKFNDGFNTPDSWEQLKKQNYGQWKNYSSMCRMAEMTNVTFYQPDGEGNVIPDVKQIRKQIAVLAWHSTEKEFNSQGFNFDAVTNVVAYQVMYWEGDLLCYSPVISGYGKYDCWERFIFGLYGLTQTPKGIVCNEQEQAISLVDGRTLINISK